MDDISRTADDALVASLAQFTHADLARAGGKGANLGELLRAGFAVPPGFVITTAAYDLVQQTDPLRAVLPAALAQLSTDATAAARVSATLRDAFARAPLPAPVADGVRSAYRALDEGAVAVRSSATAEDLPQAAFAGQQDTLLNVMGEQALFDALRRCWASLWSERAILYRARQAIDQSSVKLAVVVQRMVPADVAGVMFTANPVDGARDELVIDANPGLGEAVVGGLVTPDHFVIGKYSFKLKEQRTGRREVMIRARAGGGTEQVRPSAADGASPALPPATLRQLVRTGRRIERHFGQPQDVEWAWVQAGPQRGRLFVLQARPMTALPAPLKLSGPLRLIVPMLVEMWPARPYPLDMTTFTGALAREMGRLLDGLAGIGPALDRALVEEDDVVARFEPPAVRPSPRMLLAPWLALWRTRRCDLAHWESDPLIPQIVERARELDARDLRALAWAQNLATLREALALVTLAMELRIRYFPRALAAAGSLFVTLALARRRDSFGALLSGVETKTTETNRALETLARQIRDDPALRDLFAHSDGPGLASALQASPEGRAFLQDFEAFLAQYGHRETSLTISQPAWKDTPGVVLSILKGLAAAEPRGRESYQVWIRARDELLARSLLGSPFVRPRFLSALAGARELIRLREDTHFYATYAQPIVRHVALELGRRLVAVGALDDPPDVFHLRLDELEPLGEPWPPSPATIARIRALVARRRAKREALANKPLFDPRLLAANAPAATGAGVLLSGTGGSPGVARGPARIVRDESEFGKLQPGDVLVAPYTNPAWTPLFQRAAAVVVDSGGAASHAAIVAREYGVPAVMGTRDGTQQLRDWQWVQVDGSSGLVLSVSEGTPSYGR